MLVVQKTPRVVTYALPQTTCHYDNLCDHKGLPKPGTYRFSLEREENVLSTTRPLGIKGVQSLSVVRRSPTLMGHGKGGEVWICLTCYEGVLNDKLYQNLFGGGLKQTGPPILIEWLNVIVPETRPLLDFPDAFTLTSPQRHTVYLWVAVHRWLVYLCEHQNVKRLLDDGVYVEKAFPSDLFPALNHAEALYLDAETRDFQGRAPSGQAAELKWDQVLNKALSSSLAMSDELVEFLENEAVAGELEGPEEKGFEEDDSNQSDEGSESEDEDNDDEEDNDNEKDNDNEEDNDEEEDNDKDEEKRDDEAAFTVQDVDARAGSMENVAVNDTGMKPPLAAGASSTIPKTRPSAIPRTATRGKKRDHQGQPIVELTTSTTATNDKDRESEARSKRAKLAWERYLRSSHCF